MHDRNPTCRDCGYALRGIPSGECPECGRAFDWNKRTTYRTEDDLGLAQTLWVTRGRRAIVFVIMAGLWLLTTGGYLTGAIPWGWSCCCALLIYPLWLTGCVMAFLATLSPDGQLGLISCIAIGCMLTVVLGIPLGVFGWMGIAAALPCGLVGGLYFKHLEMSNML